MANSNNKKIITLGLDYSQMDGGISEINRKMGLLDAEFKLASESAKEFGDETTQLSLKQEQLNQKIVLQTKRVELAKEEYDKAMSSGNASEATIDRLDKALLTQRTTLEKLKNELSDVDQKLQDANKTTESFGDTIRGMASTLGLNVSPQLEAVASKFDGVNKNVGTAILGIGAIITTFAKLTIESANMADELLELSSVTGIATNELQKMQYAADFLDVEVETMTGSMTKLTRNMDLARQGADQQENAFKKLHVRYKEANGQLRDVNTVFYETIDALGRVKNETERDALAMTLMGKSAKDLNPLIETGSKRLKELGIEAENMGTVMGEDALNKLGALKDAMDKFENTTGALKNSLGLVLLPMLTSLFKVISSIPTPVLETIVVLASIIASIVMLTNAIKSVTDTGKTITGFFSGMNVQTLKTVGIVLAVVAALIALVAIIAVLAGKSNDLQKSMSSIGNSVSQVTSTVNDIPKNTSRSIGYANGTKDAIGGKAWVGEAGPEILEVPRGSKVYTNAESRELLGGGDTFIFQVDVSNIKEMNEVIEMMQRYRQAVRQGRVKNG